MAGNICSGGKRTPLGEKKRGEVSRNCNEKKVENRKAKTRLNGEQEAARQAINMQLNYRGKVGRELVVFGRMLLESPEILKFEEEAVEKYGEKEGRRLTDELLDRVVAENGDKFGDKSAMGWGMRMQRELLWNALHDSKSYERKLVADSMLGMDYISRVDAEAQKARDEDIDFVKYRIRSTLYDKQQEVYDNEFDRKIVIINSRRSGKTELMGRLIVRGLLKEDAHVVYINRTSSAAVRQIKGPLTTALEKANNLKIKSGSVESQELYFEGGRQLLIIGNNNAKDIDKLRGERISLCIMDECGHQRNVRQLMREVIEPALKDYGKGAQLVLVGTPPRIPHTYVEELWNSDAVKKYHWTFEENPFIPDREHVIEEVCKEHGCDKNEPFIQREYYGRMDVYDEDAKVIKRWAFTEPPKKTLSHAYVGVDWGYEDEAAVVSVVADDIEKRAWVVSNWSAPRKGIAEICTEIKRQVDELNEKFDLSHPVKVICDTNEKGAIADLVHVYRIKNVFEAYKYDKDFALEQLNDFLSGNRITLSEAVKKSALVTDFENTIYERDDETDKLLHEIDDAVWHPNSLFALLYVSRQYANECLRKFDKNKAAKAMFDSDIYKNAVINRVPSDISDHYKELRKIGEDAQDEGWQTVEL